jgi:hypothetical protein
MSSQVMGLNGLAGSVSDCSSRLVIMEGWIESSFSNLGRCDAAAVFTFQSVQVVAE